MTEACWRPPLRAGVSASQVRVGGERFDSVLGFLQARFPAVDDWPERLSRGAVLDARGQPLQANSPCQPGMRLWYWRSPPLEARVPFEVELLHQDERLVVVDKPHFLPVTPGGRHLHETVLVRLREQLGIDTLAPMHRLDADTAGVLVFTVQPAHRHAYQALLAQQAVHKVYEAVAGWRPELDAPLTHRCRLQEPAGDGFMQMQLVDGEPNAETFIECLRRLSLWPGQSHALYRLSPRTGRKHQLRAQMNALGLPILFDRLYPVLQRLEQVPNYTQPLQLLARSMAFTDPLDGQARCFTSRRQLLLA